MTNGTRVLVIGSTNLDYIVRVATPPRPGQTILAQTMIKHPGGKGANQAVAAARMGADVSFVGCIGDDDDGALLLRELRAEGVDTTAVEIAGNERTGLALVSVFDSGENSITVVPGANFTLGPARVRRVLESHDRGRPIVVLQAEIKTDVISAAVEAADASGARVVLNLAPYTRLSPRTLAVCDPLVVNESEAAEMVGFEVDDLGSASRASAALLGSTRSTVITLGELGAVWADASGSGHVPAPWVDAVVDSTGAGDAFVGALAAELARGNGLEAATGIGVRAGTFAVGRLGAQSSYPMRSDLEPAAPSRA